MAMMRTLFRVFFVILLAAAMASTAAARKHKRLPPSPSATPHKRSDAEIEAATRLQVFLDRVNFSPGKIDGQYNDFTLKALTLYRQSRGQPMPPPPPNSDM